MSSGRDDREGGREKEEGAFEGVSVGEDGWWKERAVGEARVRNEIEAALTGIQNEKENDKEKKKEKEKEKQSEKDKGIESGSSSGEDVACSPESSEATPEGWRKYGRLSLDADAKRPSGLSSEIRLDYLSVSLPLVYWRKR
jgi:hypothetical protein